MKLGLGSVLAAAVLGARLAHGTIYTPFGGTYDSWPSSWNGLLTDSATDYTTIQNLNLVGDNGATAAGFAVSWYQNADYVCFRLQLQPSSVTPDVFNNDSIIIYVNNAGDSKPDWGFAWDHHSNGDVSSSTHGMELQYYASGGSANLGDVSMADIDGDPAVKGPSDFQTTGGDAYVRLTTGVGSVSLVDIAVSKTKLATSTTDQLQGGQTWNIAVGTLRTGNDHSTPSADMVSGPTPGMTLINDAWSVGIAVTAVPEMPASPWLVLGFAGAVVVGSRLRTGLGRGRRDGKI